MGQLSPNSQNKSPHVAADAADTVKNERKKMIVAQERNRFLEATSFRILSEAFISPSPLVMFQTRTFLVLGMSVA
jgi:hypothetical protein